MKKILSLIFFFAFAFNAYSQIDAIRRVTTAGGRQTTGEAPQKDTLGFEHRDDLKDSISVIYRYLDSTRRNTMDSSINDFDTYFSVPSTYQYLGNNGAAAFPLVFKPFTKAGWDAGFHAFDIYKFTLEGTKFYRTRRPFSMLGYQLASGKEQMIQAGHTQNPRPNINYGLDYRLISAPGLFVTQNTSHNNYRLFGNYVGKRKRYNASLVLVGNTIRASENGGVVDDSSLLDPNKKKRFTVPVNLGGAALYAPNPFKSSISTGNTYKDFTFFVRQGYDIGKKDSVAINDSTTEYLFYPKLRFQHTLTYNTQSYGFSDVAADSSIYEQWYDTTLRGPSDTVLKGRPDTFAVFEKWTILSNDFSLLQFPDTKNPAQFILAGITYQQLKQELELTSRTFNNIMLHGEYRNTTRNKLWDVLLKGEFYLEGLNGGDYSMYATIGRYLNKKFGNVQLFFTNVNRTPSFIFDNRSAFNLGNNNNFNKENITSFGATATNPFIKLGFANHLLTNYTYFRDYYHTAQSGKVINILQVSASRKTRLSKKWNLYTEVVLQQTDGASPIKVPLFYTRNRLAFEGVFYKNLNLSAGLEGRYYTPYKADNYSPVMGKFMPQDTVTIKNIPDISAFFHFRIKGFTAFIRAENLNTVSLNDGFAFTNNNFAAPHYPTAGLMIRFGIRWWFVN